MSLLSEPSSPIPVPAISVAAKTKLATGEMRLTALESRTSLSNL
jgi:hypothetical protein